MKTLISMLLLVPMVLLGVPRLNVTTGKLSHVCGEEMAFAIHALEGNDEVTAEVKWSLDADDGRSTERGTGTVAPGAPLVVKTSLGKPGFVRLVASLTSGNGKFVASAAAEMERLEGVEEPEDFDAFWDAQRAFVDSIDLSKAVVEAAPAEVAEKRKGYRVSRVTIPLGEGMQPATAWVVIPENATARSVKFIKAQFEGYGMGGQGAPGGAGDSIVLGINAHGFELGREGEYYKQFSEDIKSGGHGYAFDPVQNASRETSYFRGMILRDLLVLRWAKTLPEYMGWGVFVQGGSQGGFQALAMAALDKKVITCMPMVPWMCDLGGDAKLGRMKSNFRPAYTPALRYFDSVNFAKRITCGVIILRGGLGDYVCPPSGVAVLYNALGKQAKSRSIHWIQGSDHNDWNPPAQGTEVFDFKENK